LGVQNPAVVELFLRYLYTLDNDGTKAPALKDPFFEEPPPATDAGSETSQPKNRSSAPGSTGRTTGSEEARYDYHANADDQLVACHHRLIINMGVYAMADMYRIPALMQLAQFMFETCAATWPHGAFPAVIQRILVFSQALTIRAFGDSVPRSARSICMGSSSYAEKRAIWTDGPT